MFKNVVGIACAATCLASSASAGLVPVSHQAITTSSTRDPENVTLNDPTATDQTISEADPVFGTYRSTSLQRDSSFSPGGSRIAIEIHASATCSTPDPYVNLGTRCTDTEILTFDNDVPQPFRFSASGESNFTGSSFANASAGLRANSSVPIYQDGIGSVQSIEIGGSRFDNVATGYLPVGSYIVDGGCTTNSITEEVSSEIASQSLSAALELPTMGDANFDGSVGFSDLVILAQHYNQSGQSWFAGDFNGDGTVSFPDLVALAQHYNSPSSLGGETSPEFARDWAAAQSLAPEPSMLAAFLGLAATSLRFRRHP